MRAFLALGAAVICTLGRWAAAHPTCLYDSRPPDTETIHTFCPTEEDGACCNVLEEAAVLSWYNNQTVVTDVCAEYYKQVRLTFFAGDTAFGARDQQLNILVPRFNVP